MELDWPDGMKDIHLSASMNSSTSKHRVSSGPDVLLWWPSSIVVVIISIIIIIIIFIVQGGLRTCLVVGLVCLVIFAGRVLFYGLLDDIDCPAQEVRVAHLALEGKGFARLSSAGSQPS